MDWFTPAVVIVCLFVSAFFSASETALTGASRASMLRLSKQGNREAGVVSSLFAMRERMIGALLLGNNIANIGASALATGIFTGWFGEVGVLYATAVMTVLVVIFAEVLPKTIAINAPDRVALLVARPMKVMVYLLGPRLTIIEVLHAKDLLRAIRSAEGDTSKIDVSTIALPPWFVPEMRPVSEQLKAFRRRKTHFALVVDEYGEVEGMVTLEDILEEIVGDISDEHDVVVAGVRAQPDGSVVVDGSVPIRDLNRAMDWHLPDEEATTVAGLVIHEARSIPERVQSFTFHGFRFLVLRRERNRITALRIVPVAREAEVEEEKPKPAGTAFCLSYPPLDRPLREACRLSPFPPTP